MLLYKKMKPHFILNSLLISEKIDRTFFFSDNFLIIFFYWKIYINSIQKKNKMNPW